MSLKPLSLPWKPIFPSQRSGAPFLEYGFWQGEERCFVLQWYEDRVYFQLADGEPTLWATLDACQEDDAITCWHEALFGKRIGLCFSSYHNITRPSFYTQLHIICGINGDCLAREWFSRTWIPFTAPASRAWVLCPDVLLLQKKRVRRDDRGYGAFFSNLEAIENDLLNYRFSDEDIDYLALRSSSTQDEFTRVMRWLNAAGLLSHRHIGIGTWSAFRYSLNLSVLWDGNSEFCAWLERYFWIQGYQWRRTGWGRRQLRRLRKREPNMRLFLEPVPVAWTVPFDRSVEPTFHERLEAKLELREWLREKAPEADHEKWLASQP